jgi:mRNA-degrading endonuclease RelE of RelBE toxin-antitoxin system
VKVELSKQVVDFVRRLPPEVKGAVRAALRQLGKGKGDIKALEPPLDGYCRLRVGGYRILLSYTKGGAVQCIFAERRSVVYEVFADAVRMALTRPDEGDA